MSQDFTLFKQRLEESGLNKEQVESILEIARNSIYLKKYGLVWEEKDEIIKEELKYKLPYLEEVKEREIKIGEPNSPQHLLIEGDNYEALKLLQTTHRGKVNVIYIDPPYNTGNKDFKYNDRYLDKDDAWKHSCWLSFMHKRLILAKELMSEDGVIFISIDDNEMAQLKLLCDEVFGEKNFVSTFTWIKKRKPSNLNKIVRNNTEYVLCYSKNIIKTNPFKSMEAEDEKPYPFYNSGNNRKILKFPGNFIECPSLEDGHYPAQIFKDKKTTVKLLDDIIVKNNLIINDFRLEGEWRYSQETLSEFIKNKETIVIKGNKFKPYYIRKLKGSLSEMKNAITILGGVGRTTNAVDYPELKIGTNEDGEQEIYEIGLGKEFSFPKPKSLISFLIKVATVYNSESIVLDFFAGSGTTGHAVLELNQEDGGNRQFILCTNNENNICEDVTYERLKRVMNGYTTPKGKEVEGLPANLKYLKVEHK